MSVSQYKGFMNCEARALAELNQTWDRGTDNTALLVGNYVHSYFESPEVHEKFKEENKEHMYSSRKPYGLKADFKIAERMIERLLKDPQFHHVWKGEAEHIVTGEVFGVKWKGKIDMLNVEDGYFVDIKTSQDLRKRFFSKKYGGYVSFVEEYGYILQMALYTKLLENKFNKPFDNLIYAVSKQTPCDIEAIQPQERQLEFEMSELQKSIKRVMQVKNGEVKPTMCRKCDYCREHKELDGFILTDELIN